MASQISRNLSRSLRGRLYSTQTAVKSESSAGGGDAVQTTKANGIPVISTDERSPLSRVVFAIKAGSRYENMGNLGTTHVLRHAGQMSTEASLAKHLIQDLQGVGGSLTYSTTRENAYITLTCVRDYLAEAMSLVCPTVSRTYLEAKEFNFNAKVEHDLAMLQLQPNVHLIELLHEAAFETTLGNSLYSPATCVGTVSLQSCKEFLESHYKADRIAVAASGVYHKDLEGMVNLMKFNTAGGKPNETQATYKGGVRKVVQPSSANTYAAVAHQGPSYGSEHHLPAAVLQQILGTGPAIKYMNSSSSTVLGKALAAKIGETTPYSAAGYYSSYSDSGLFGYTVAAPVGDIKKVMEAAADSVGEFASADISDAQVTAGKNMLKASLAMAAEKGEVKLADYAAQAVLDGTVKTVIDVLSVVDNISADDVKAAQKSIFSSAPSTAIVGNLNY